MNSWPKSNPFGISSKADRLEKRGDRLVKKGQRIATKGKGLYLRGMALRQQPPKPKKHVPMWVWYFAGAVSFIAIVAAALSDYGVLS